MALEGAKVQAASSVIWLVVIIGFFVLLGRRGGRGGG
jgi:hypothetical protein